MRPSDEMSEQLKYLAVATINWSAGSDMGIEYNH